MTPVDEDALSVMKDIGQEFAEKQYFRWMTDDWRLGPEINKERMAHWRAVKDRIGELIRQFKQEMKNAGGNHN